MLANITRCRPPSKSPLSLLPFVWLSVWFTHSLFSKCVYPSIIFPLSLSSRCVCVCLSQTVWCSLASWPSPPPPTVRGILYHVSAVFRELSRKIKHRGLTVPPPNFLTTTTPPKRPHLAPCHSMWHFFFYGFNLPFPQTSQQLHGDRANFVCSL